MTVKFRSSHHHLWNRRRAALKTSLIWLRSSSCSTGRGNNPHDRCSLASVASRGLLLHSTLGSLTSFLTRFLKDREHWRHMNIVQENSDKSTCWWGWRHRWGPTETRARCLQEHICVAGCQDEQRFVLQWREQPNDDKWTRNRFSEIRNCTKQTNKNMQVKRTENIPAFHIICFV